MFNVSFMDSISGLLPAGAIMAYPFWLFEMNQDIIRTPATSIEAQGWILAVVGAGMGLVKIALWLRNYKDTKEDGNGIQDLKDISAKSANNLERFIDKVAGTEENLAENQRILTVNQQKLTDNQLRALENHAKLFEAIALLRMQLQNTENNITSLYERRSLSAMAEIKDYLRNILKEK